MQHPFPMCITHKVRQKNERNIKPSFTNWWSFDQYFPLLTFKTVFIKMNNNATLFQAAENIERCERGMRNKWQDLPDELILKILSYSEVKDLISSGQVSKRTRSISRDSSLWVTVNLEKKIVKAELLEMILIKGCKNLNISGSTIIGSLSSNIKSQSQLRALILSKSPSELKWFYKH